MVSECSGLFSCEFKQGQAGLGCDSICIWLSLNFGWRGGPGCFVHFATFLIVLHANLHPSREEWHDRTPFKSLMLMDDQVAIEPSLGLRPYMSMGLMESILLQLLGPQSLNFTKDLEEGTFTFSKMIWDNYGRVHLCTDLPLII